MQTQPATSAISIGSKHFINSLESTIIQIARSLAMEHKVPVDPEAKEMTRGIVQTRINSLLDEKTVKELKRLKEEVSETIKTTKDQALKELAIKTYHLLKLAALDDI